MGSFISVLSLGRYTNRAGEQIKKSRLLQNRLRTLDALFECLIMSYNRNPPKKNYELIRKTHMGFLKLERNKQQ
nr:MAG TPA: hypothetical protein [Bacteriophage sp.]